MWPFGKKEKFNAVIEGTYYDDWTNLNYKIAQLQIPEHVTVLNDGHDTYNLFGETSDFQTFKTVGETVGLEAVIDFLGHCEGVVLPYRGGFPFIDRPRTVCMRNGRIYVEKTMAASEAYLKMIPSILKTADEIFRDKKLSELYEKAAKSVPKLCIE